MKSYIAQDRIHAQGKAWQIRILLSQWMKEAGGAVPLSEFIHTRTRQSTTAHGGSKAGR
ncbi:Z-ring formation inhibitor MciZ [Paenibacillus sanguinis]|uniref:Z-ring formation inhibitor MciZ n=1 Tax=Paenibacillus sanguinis TaxID=225906 RepID=UPI0003701AF9|nr:Z-ring formation inhibitor MciZ [Paenibacillus sanguinis]